jgi:hypothetical protein
MSRLLLMACKTAAAVPAQMCTPAAPLLLLMLLLRSLPQHTTALHTEGCSMHAHVFLLHAVTAAVAAAVA